MTTTNTTNRKQMSMAKVVVILLVVALLCSSQAPAAKASGRIKGDWSRVQTVTPGTRTTVLLYKDLAPRGKRKIKGRFHSATPESVTILLKQGQTRTVEKKDVRRVLVYRPIGNRYEIFAAPVAVTALIFRVLLSTTTGAESLGEYLVPAALGGALAGGIAILVAPKMRGIYNASRKSKKRQGSAPNRRDF